MAAVNLTHGATHGVTLALLVVSPLKPTREQALGRAENPGNPKPSGPSHDCGSGR